MNETMVLSKRDEEAEDTFRIWEEMDSGEFYRKFNDIIDSLEELYFKEDKEWMVTYSGGKDSSLVLSLVFKMLNRLPKAKRFKRVHIVSADTKVESYQMTSYLKKNLKLIKSFEDELNIRVHLVKPDMKNSYFWNVIGRGNVAPKPPSPFQWCTKKMKIIPMNKKTKEILSQAPVNFTNGLAEYGIEVKEKSERPYDLIMLLGSRVDESTKRARSINKFSFDEKDVFAWNPDFKNVKMCNAVKFIKTSDLWTYIRGEEYLPWGLPSIELWDMYSDGSGECPMTRGELTETKACGSSNSRNGCWVCLYSGKRDKMLETLISSGHSEVQYLSEWKAYLFDVTYDIRYREPLKRKEVKDNNKKIEQAKVETMDIFSFLEDDPMINRYNNFEKGEKTEYEPGGFTFEIRLKLLQKLLYTQKMVGYSLIENNELMAILKNWEEEGYIFSDEDIKPFNHQYDGSLVLKKDGVINDKETTNPNKVFYVKVKLRQNEAEIKDLIKERQIKTSKSFYCFFDNKDIKKYYAAYNFLNFIVCQEEIKTQEAAEHLIFEWLFDKSSNDLQKPVSFENQNRFNNALIVNAIDGVLPNLETIPKEYAGFFKDLISKNLM
ncbi:phosphoadenosine phosphosulfate reductase family protein [[Brevibacterium] frigoritolerans]|nr:phosphoadenosine phosphosulfate reductase family protein [Peribacillus frigoritolerans]